MADKPKDDVYTQPIDPNGLNPHSDPNNFLGQVLNRVVGDKPQAEGVTPSISPIDLLAPTVGGAAIEAAPRLLANEVGAIGPDIAQLLAKQATGEVLTLPEQIQLAAAKNPVQGPIGGLTNNAAMQQAGTPFQQSASQNAALWQQATKTPRRYADGGEVTLPLTGQEIAAQAAASAPNFGQAAASPTAAPTGEVHVFDPQGNLGTIPAHQLQAAVTEGYRPASDQDVSKHLAEQKYGGAGQQAIAGLEGVAQGVAGPVATATEMALGVPKEDILGREEANPATNIVGQGAGLVGGSLIGTTEARGLVTLPKLAEMGAAKVAEHLLPEATTTIAKIGSAAVKGAVENSIIQSGNEASKMILQDPKQSVQSALVDVGLAGLIGGNISGVIGSVPPLWKATLGKQTDGILSAISNKMGGIEGVNSDVIDQAISQAGLKGDQVAPEIRAALSQNPTVRQQAQILMDSASSSGVKYQEALKTFRNTLNNHALEIMGKTPEDIDRIANLDTHQAGNNIRDMVKAEIEGRHGPIGAQYDKIAERFKGVELAPGIKSQLSDDIGATLGSGVSPESPSAKLVARVMKEVPALENLEQLRNYTSDLMREVNHFTKPEYGAVAPALRRALNDAEENALNHAVESEAPELLSQHLEANKNYKALMSTVNELNDRLSVGSFRGPKGFLRALDNMDPETIVSRLNPANRAGIIEELNRSFPAVAKEVQDFQLSKLIRQASQRSQRLGYEGIDVKEFNKILTGKNMSPQMRDFLVAPESQARLQGLESLIEHLPEKIGKSGTPQGISGLLQHIPEGAAAGLAYTLGSHNLVTAGLAGALAHTVVAAPDAVRLGLLKFLGSAKEIEPGAFKATVDYIQSALKGDAAISKATKAIFKAGREVLPQALVPNEKDRQKLDKAVQTASQDPNHLLNVGGATTHYMEDHAQHMGETAANAVSYLKSMRPNNTPTTPLGKALPIDPVRKAQYDRVLSIAQQPLTVLARLQKGSITVGDVQALKTMYPALYTKFTNQLMSNMTEELAKGHSIPYATRLGMAVFLGQPLDGTMTPQAMMAAQSIYAPQQPPAQQGALRPTQGGEKGLAKLPASYQTPGQKREASRSGTK